MQTKIRELLKDAMRSKDENRLSVYRGLLTAFMNELVAKGKTPQDTLSEEDCVLIVKRSIKQRIDAFNQFESAGRMDLAEKEEVERKILLDFLPPQLSEEEVLAKVSQILESQKPLDQKMLGKYIGLCNSSLKEFTSGDVIKKSVEKYLSENL
jgi:uncharacterized protein YqeY